MTVNFTFPGIDRAATANVPNSRQTCQPSVKTWLSRTGSMLQTVSFRPEMERQSPCNQLWHHLPQGRAVRPATIQLMMRVIGCSLPDAARFCEEMKERQ